MRAKRRAAIRRLASNAYEMDLDVMNGVLTREQDGHWRIGTKDLEQWLAAHIDKELVVVMGVLDDDRPVKIRTCGTCGRDYADLECPHCRANRMRLRGQA